jgi:hypothetical protein
MVEWIEPIEPRATKGAINYTNFLIYGVFSFNFLKVIVFDSIQKFLP